MNEVRAAFLDTSAAGRAVAADEAVGAKWDEPSALERWSVSGLTGHLMRATWAVEGYLVADEPDGPPSDPPTYYATVLDDDDLDSELHRSIRQRGDERAADGHAALLAEWDEILERLGIRLETERSGRLVEVFKGFVLTLDDYLITRMVEMTVHIDDLCVSVGIETPELPRLATQLSIRTLVDVGRHKHGDVNVLRALTRRERDAEQALRVL
jgi:hypothetical protein